MAINTSGILKSPQGSAIQNAEIIFEQTRTSTEVLAGTKFSVITNQTGNYSSSLGVGTYVFKVRFQDETQYRTVASNVIVTQSMNNYSLNQIIQDQSQLQDVDYNLLQDVIQARDQAAASKQAAQSSQATASTKASEAASSQSAALTSKDAAATSATNAASSDTNALASKNAAATSATNAQSSATQAASSATNAATSATQSATSEKNALASKNAAATSATNAASSESAALTSKNAAATSATNAATSETNALASKNAAATSATNAASSETNALASKNAAQASATSAQSSATQASTSETKAATSQTDALASKNAAATSATNATTSETNAAASATNAASSATNAASSQSAALTSKDAAATSATNAASSDTNALASKNAAQASQTAAANSQTSAATSQTTATTKATEASNSAQAALASKNAAQNSETNALASKNAAQASQTTASTKASEAAASQTTATTKASEASASQTQAQQSQSGAQDSAQQANTSASDAQSSQASASTSQTTATTKATEASNSAQAALASKNAAQTSETSALSSKNQAQTSQTNAASSQAAAAGSQTTASTKASQAATSQTQAQQSQSDAGSAASQADSSAQQAQQSQTSASTSQTTATTKASEAYSSAQAALASKNAAQTSETNALSSKNAAQTSQTNAAGSQTAASTSQTTASTKAGEASTSQTNAAASQTTATTKAGEASTSQTNAATSQATATTKAGEASTSQTNAASSQSTATTKATEATNSATLAQKWAANPENSVVSGGLYSALHYAAKAAQSAQTASGQLVWRGGWSAQAGTAPPNPNGLTQDFYRITQAGTILSVQYEIGDYIHWDNINSIWFKMDGTDSVTSVNGRTGAVVVTKTDVGLSAVNNWAASSQTNDASTTTYATTAGVKAAYDLAATKLTATANAVSATKLVTARTINGTNFDGTVNITTQNWGTSRNLTIGETSKAVNGSADTSWTLSEIGAIPATLLPTGSNYQDVVSKLIRVGSDGVQEVGRILDFHAVDSVLDNDVRLTVTNETGAISRGDLEITARTVRVNGNEVYHQGNTSPGALGAVPDTRTVNGKRLNTDIQLVPQDLGTLTTSEIEALGRKSITINQPAGLVQGKYYPIVVSNYYSDQALYITTRNSVQSDPMNNCSFDGIVRSGGWSDRSSIVDGVFTAYSSSERAIHSIVGPSEQDGVYAIYVEARQFPVVVRVQGSQTVQCTGENISYGTSTFVAQVGNPSTITGATNKLNMLADFAKGPGRYRWSSLYYHEGNKPTPADIGALQAGATAVAATKLETARTIGGVAFDGTANIDLPGVNTAGNQSTTGNAATATKLQTARTIALTGDVTGSVNFDGSGNVSITTTVADDSHNHTIANIVDLQNTLNGKLSTSGKAADSDKLDGLDSSQFLRSDTSNTMTGNLTVTGTAAATKHQAPTHNVGTGSTGFDIAYNSTTKSLDFNFVG